MIDKSVPYVEVLMKRKKGTAIPDVKLPAGYNFAYFKKGDEKAWAKIETSVLEFSNEFEALIYFQEKFMSFVSELELRCIFIENQAGEKIATATAWWCYLGNRRDPILHWVAVKPDYQRLGLGNAIVSKAVKLLIEIEGDIDIYLHTQTWSHKAIKLYKKIGFEISNEKNLPKYTNESYEKALDILKNIYHT